MKRKCIFVLGFILLLFLFFNISESKASFEINNSLVNVSLPNLPSFQNEYFAIILNGPKTQYHLITSDKPITYSHPFSTSDGRERIYANNVKSWSVKTSTLDNWSTAGFGNIIYLNDGSKVVYSNHAIYYDKTDPDHSGLFHEIDEFDFYYNYFEEENMYQVATNFFDISSLNNVICSISSDNINFIEMDLGIDDIGNKFEFYYNLYKNGTYYIKYKNISEDIEQIYSFTIDNLIEEETYSLNLHLSTTEQTIEPIYILSNKYYYEGEYNAEEDFLNNYDIDIAYGLESPYQFSPFSIDGTDENGTFRQYQYKIVANGVYQAKILDFNTGEISYQVFNVTNIGVKNKWGDDVYYNNYNENGEFDPTPVLFLEYVNINTVRIRTQPFIFNELMYLECYFSSDGENYEKVENIYKYSIDTENSSYDYNTGEKQNIQDLYYFYYDVQIDGTYFFKFYNIDLDKYTSSSIEVNIREFVTSNIDNINDFGQRISIWVKEHFGVLTFPFEFIFKLCNRILQIEESEPILHIPELRDPFFNYKILDATDFNFNSILENNVVKTIYNIYLVAVDCIFIFIFLVFCKRTFEEVFPSD